MSRLAKKVEQEQSRQARLRPYVLGVSVALVLVATVFVAGFWEAEPEELPPPVTAGRIHVGGEEALGAPRGGEPKATPLAPAPVRFYELLSQGDSPTAEIADPLVVRDLPLPPPAGEVAPVVTVAPTPPAVASAPKPVADAEIDTLATPTPAVVAKAPVVTPLPKASPPPVKAPKSAPKRPAKKQQQAAPPAVVSKTPAKVAPAPAKAPVAAMPYTLQVGSFSRRDRADELAARLGSGGHDAYTMEVDLGAKGVWWRVRVGHYPTAQAARWAKLDLVKLGVSPMVVRDRPSP